MWLTLTLHLFIGATFTGMALIAALVAGGDTVAPLVGAAAFGFLVSLPLSWLVARRLGDIG